MTGRPPIERASPSDLAARALSASSPVPEQIGAVLVLDPPPGFDVVAAQRLIAGRLAAVPRLRQRLVRVPPFGGRPVWLEDPLFDPAAHVRCVPCPPPGDEQAVLDLATSLVLARLPADRPLWSATFVTGPADDRIALVVVLDHVLADGIGGLAVLARLVDHPGTEDGPAPPPAGRPPYRLLVADALRSKVRALARLPQTWRGLRGVLAAGGGMHPPQAQACSLLSRTGGGRRTAVARAPLAALRTTAHRCGGTVNDALLAAVAGAVERLLATRGESLDTVLVAVIVAARRSADAAQLGNAAAPLLVAVPAAGSPLDRLARIAGHVRAARASATTAPLTALLGPVFRALAAVGAYRWYIDRQRRFHTLVSNVPGPDRPLSLAGVPVLSMIPISVGEAGNVSITFVALSYAGTLTVTVVADAAVPDLPDLAAALQAELDGLTGPAADDRA